MRKLLLLALSAGLLVYALSPQWRSFERMGQRRFRALSRPPKEILVGVCWPFSVNRDAMADGLQLVMASSILLSVSAQSDPDFPPT